MHSRRRLMTTGILLAALTVGWPVSTPAQLVRCVGAEAFGLCNRHADLTAVVNSANVKQMRRAWTVSTGQHPVTHTPLVRGTRVFFADWGGTVYAVEATTGKVLWKNRVMEPKPWPWHGFAGTGALGEGVADGLLFEASVEGEAYALDTSTGRVAWKTRFTDHPLAGNVGALLYYDGLVYVPVQSVVEPLTARKDLPNVNFRGEVVALDARTGRVVWERPTVTPPHNGVPVWSAFALDPDLNTLYFTTGNNYTGEASPGSDALWAVDARTGEVKWVRQVVEHDIWTMADPKGPDYDFGAGPQLFEAVIAGVPRKLVGAGNKSGIFFTWDRVTGEPLWTTTAGYGHIGGGIHAEASVGDGALYIWGNHAYPYKNPQQHPMDIKKVDASTGKYLWVKAKAQPAQLTSAGYLANDVFFVGSLDGKVRAYRATDGELLWTSQPHGAVGSSLVVQGSMLLWGGSAPASFGGAKQPNGLFAYTAGAGGGSSRE